MHFLSVALCRHIFCPISVLACCEGAEIVHLERTTPPNPLKDATGRDVLLSPIRTQASGGAIRKPRRKSVTHLEEAGIMRFSTPLSACLGATTGGFHPGASSGTSLVASAGLGGAFFREGRQRGKSAFGFSGLGGGGEGGNVLGQGVPAVLEDTICPSVQDGKAQLGRRSFPSSFILLSTRRAVELKIYIIPKGACTKISLGTHAREKTASKEEGMIVVMSPAKTLNMGPVAGFPLTAPHFTVGNPGIPLPGASQHPLSSSFPQTSSATAARGREKSRWGMEPQTHRRLHSQP
jgi:hypothetical protein